MAAESFRLNGTTAVQDTKGGKGLCLLFIQQSRLLTWGGMLDEQVKNMLMRTVLANCMYRFNKLQKCVFRQNVFLSCIAFSGSQSNG